MLQPYDLMEQLLSAIEDHITETVTISDLSERFYISSVHLQRLFKFAFGIPLAGYIRSRKLAASVEKLLSTDYRIIDIANEYGFAHEQAYIRAFKKEYHITPGELRRLGTVIKVLPPLQIFPENKLQNGAMFGPDIVMVPEFQVIGRRFEVPFDQSVVLPPQLAKSFWEEDSFRIKNIAETNVYYGITRIGDLKDGYSYYMPSVKVKDISHIPEGMMADCFPTCMCARFHYIGKHHYYDINADMARGMYDAICDFANKEGKKYETQYQKLYFERISDEDYDGTYCQMEWFTPIRHLY